MSDNDAEIAAFVRKYDDDLEVRSDDDGVTILVDMESELGEKLAWHAGHNAESPEDFLKQAVREKLEDNEVSR